MILCSEIREKINRAAKQGEPFLFCIDYELPNGSFIKNPLQEKSILWRIGGITNSHSSIPLKGTLFNKQPILYVTVSAMTYCDIYPCKPPLFHKKMVQL